MAAPAYANTGTPDYDEGAVTLAPGKPSSTASGDLLLMVVNLWEWGVFGVSPSVTSAPSGWTAITNVTQAAGDGFNWVRQYAYYRIADGSEGSTFSVGVSCSGGSAYVHRYTGASGVDVSASWSGGAWTLSRRLTSVTTTGSDRLVVGAFFSFAGENDSPAPSGWTKDYSEGGADDTGFVWSKTAASAGATGNTDFDETDNYTLRVGITVALKGPLTLAPAGSITGTGAARRSASKTAIGSTSPAAAVRRGVTAARTGSISAAGALARTVAKRTTGTLTATGSLAAIRSFLRSYTGTVTPTGASTRSTAKRVTGSATASGALTAVRTYLRSFAGSTTGASMLSRVDAKATAGAVAASGAAARSTGKRASGAISVSGALSAVRSFVRSYAGSVTGSGTSARSTGKGLAGTVSATGALTAIRSFLRSYTSTVVATSTLRRTIGKTAPSSITPTGSARRSTAIAPHGTISPSGLIRRNAARLLVGAITSAATVARAVAKRVGSGITPASTLTNVPSSGAARPGRATRNYRAATATAGEPVAATAAAGVRGPTVTYTYLVKD